ncbi:MAG: CAP domain-containing protein [Nitrospirae bacterium]|jgi:uncharacterized protein YkwD|nr:CAP domain-containing protein [Nitrospirota bacterium]
MFLFALFLIVMLVNSCGTVMYTSSGIYKSHSMVESIIEPINKARTSGIMCGNEYYKAAPPVVWNEKLAQASLQHSLDMAENGFLSHKGSDGSDPGERLLMAGYRWSLYGEDVGQGYQAPEDAVRSWLKSKMHCKNIMNPEFKEAGAAYARSGNLRTYWTLVLGTPGK